MAVGRGGYAGLVRVEDGNLNLAAALAPEMLLTPARRKPQSPLCSTKRACANLSYSPGGCWAGTAPLTQYVVRPAGWRVLLLGDSAGYIEPFTGKGIAWAGKRHGDRPHRGMRRA